MAKVLSYDEILDAMRYLGYQVGTRRDPKGVNRRAAATADTLSKKKVVESHLLGTQIAVEWGNQPKCTTAEMEGNES